MPDLHPPAPTLLRNPDFVKLWAGQAVSVFGSLITRTALPFTAILALKATPGQMAVLAAADLVPGLLVGLMAGVWADRFRRRPILIAADAGRALLLLSVPAAAVLGALRIEQLYLVTFLCGVLTTFFDVAYHSYLPSLVRPEQLVEGNSKLSASGSVAEACAFGASGWLVQWIGGPMAILVDASTFVVSALSIAGIRRPEDPPPAFPTPRAVARGSAARAFVREVRDGVAIIAGHPVLRVLAGVTLLGGLSGGLVGPVYLLYVTETLGVKPGVQGLIYGIGGVTSLLGALGAAWCLRRLGLGPSMALGLLLGTLGLVCTPLAHGNGPSALLLLVATQLLSDPGLTIYGIHETSLRQAITPGHVLGRVNGSMRLAGLLAALAGTLLGGLLGGSLGLRSTLYAGVIVSLLAAALLALSPVSRLRSLPGGPE